MKRLFLIIGILIILGIILFVTILAANGWDFTKLSTAKYQSNSYTLEEGFKNISVSTNTADVTLILSDGPCKVECYEQENMTHRVSVQDGKLEISVNDTRKWYGHISLFSFDTPKITVYLSPAEYAALSIRTDTGDVEIPKDFRFESVDIAVSTGDVKCYASANGQIKIKSSTGDILAESISADILNLTVSTGKTTLKDAQCNNLRSEGDTGDLHLQNVIAKETFSIERSTGDVKLDRCDAAEIEIETDTGNVTGSLLSPKIFWAETDTGRVDVPKSTTGGRCQIETDTGNIKITTP